MADVQALVSTTVFGNPRRMASGVDQGRLSLLLAVSLIAFVLVTASPVDPVQQYILGLGTAVSPEQRAQIEAYWGVDQPPVQRYLSWLSSVLHGDLGVSSLYRRPVAEILAERFGNSLALMVSAWVLSGLLGFGVGCAMGLFRDRWPDRLLKKVCYVLSSVPTAVPPRASSVTGTLQPDRAAAAAASSTAAG